MPLTFGSVRGLSRAGWDLARASGDQRRRQHLTPRRPAIAVEAREEQLGGVLAERVGILRDDGHARLDADPRAATSSKPTSATLCCSSELVQRARRADRDQVLAGEQRGGRVRSPRAARAPRRQRRRRGSPGARTSAPSCGRRVGERLAVAAQPLGGREDRRPVAEERDPAMAGAIRCSTAARAPPALSLTTASASMKRGGRSTNTSADAGRDVARAGSCGRRSAGTMTRPSTPRAPGTPRPARARAPGSSSELPANVSTPTRPRDVLDAAVDGREERVRDVLEDQPDAGRQAVGAAQVAAAELWR